MPKLIFRLQAKDESFGRTMDIAQKKLKKHSELFSNINKDSNRATATNLKLGRSLPVLRYAAFAAVVMKTGRAIYNSINASMDQIETQNLFNVALADTAVETGKAIELMSEFYGLDSTNIRNTVGTFALLSRSMGMTTDQAKTLSLSTYQLGADLASLTNIPFEQVMGDLRSGLLGQSETVYKYGMDVTESAIKSEALAQGIEKSVRQMSQGEKMALRYAVMIKTGAIAQGDFAKTIEEPANQLRVLRERMVTLSRSIGSIFMPIVGAVLPYLNAFVILLIKAANAIAALVGYEKALDENTESTFSGVADNAGDAENAIGGVTKAVKKLKATMLGFDELNIMNSPTESTPSAGGGLDFGQSIITDMEIGEYNSLMDKIPTKAHEIADKLQGIFFRIRDRFLGIFSGNSDSTAFNDMYINFLTFKDRFYTLFFNFKVTMLGIWNDLSTLGEPLTEWLGGEFLNLLTTYLGSATNIFFSTLDAIQKIFGDIWDVAIFPILESFITTGLPMITEFATGSIQWFDDMYNNLLGKFMEVWDEDIKPTLDHLIQTALPMVEDFTGRFIESFEKLRDKIEPIVDMVWNDSIKPAIEGVTKVINDLIDIFEELYWKYIDPISTKIDNAIDSTGDVFQKVWKEDLKPVFDKIMEVADRLWNRHLKPLVVKIGTFVGELVNFALVIYNKFILPLITWVSKNLAPAFRIAFDFISDVVGTVVATIIDVLGGIITIATGIIEFLTGIFTGDWDKVWSGALKTVEGTFEIVGGVLRGVINIIIDMIELLLNSIINGFNKGIESVNKGIDGVNKILSKMGLPTVKVSVKPINKVYIPALADGGIVNSATLAMVGEAGREAVLPLNSSALEKYLAPVLGNNNISEDDMYKAVYRAITDVDRESPSENVYNIYVDGVYDKTVKDMRRKNIRSGRIIVPIGG